MTEQKSPAGFSVHSVFAKQNDWKTNYHQLQTMSAQLERMSRNSNTQVYDIRSHEEMSVADKCKQYLAIKRTHGVSTSSSSLSSCSSSSSCTPLTLNMSNTVVTTNAQHIDLREITNKKTTDTNVINTSTQTNAVTNQSLPSLQSLLADVTKPDVISSSVSSSESSATQYETGHIFTKRRITLWLSDSDTQPHHQIIFDSTEKKIIQEFNLSDYAICPSVSLPWSEELLDKYEGLTKIWKQHDISQENFFLMNQEFNHDTDRLATIQSGFDEYQILRVVEFDRIADEDWKQIYDLCAIQNLDTICCSWFNSDSGNIEQCQIMVTAVFWSDCELVFQIHEDHHDFDDFSLLN